MYIAQDSCKNKAAWKTNSSVGAGSPLSHTREWRRAKRSGGVESGEEATRKCHSFRHFATDFALAAKQLVLQRGPACAPT